eukprot:scaffold152648_cov31-Tisochrysis_lutea.AAC.2
MGTHHRRDACHSKGGRNHPSRCLVVSSSINTCDCEYGVQAMTQGSSECEHGFPPRPSRARSSRWRGGRALSAACMAHGDHGGEQRGRERGRAERGAPWGRAARERGGRAERGASG